MRTGQQVYQSITTAEAAVVEKHERIGREISKLEDDIREAVNTRARCYEEIAQMHLPELTATAIRNLSFMGSELNAFFNKRQREKQVFEKQMEAITANKGELQRALQEKNTTLSEIINEKQKITTVIAEELRESQEYRQIIGLERRSEGAVASAKASKDKKPNEEQLKAFRESDLFMYLVKKKHEWKRSKLDDFVAEVVQFSINKPRYDALLGRDATLESALAEKERELQTIREQKASFVTQVENKYCLGTIMTKESQYSTEKGQITREIQSCDREYGTLARTVQEIQNTRGEDYKAAKGKYREALENQGIVRLREIARNTPGTRDDELVRLIDQADDTVDTLRGDIKRWNGERAQTGRIIAEYERVRQHFSSCNYDSSRSSFSYIHMGDLLEQLSLGNVTAGTINSQLDSHHHREPEPEPVYRTPKWESNTWESSRTTDNDNRRNDNYETSGYTSVQESGSSDFGSNDYQTTDES